MSPVATGSKVLAELEAQFKKGYSMEQTGGGHYRVRGPNGKVVELNGKVLSLTGTAHGGRAANNMRAQLKSAGVLKPTEEHKARNGQDPQKQARAERARAMVAERNKNMAATAKALRERIAEAVRPVGGVTLPGMQADLAYVAAHLSHEMLEKPVDPGLTQASISKILAGHYVDPKYQGLWNELAQRLEDADDRQEYWFTLVRRARGLPEQIVVAKDQKGTLAEADWPFEMQLLPIGSLFADHAYQRPPDWPFIRRSAAVFDERLVGAIDVAERKRREQFAILDGQQRYEMMRLVGKTTVWASVYKGFDLKEEARFFLHKNRDKKAIHTYYTFMARITAGDEAAIEIDKLVKKYKYKLSITSAAHDESHISAVKALEAAYDRPTEVRDNCLEPTLWTLNESTRGLPQGQNTSLIRGLSHVFATYGDDEIDYDRLTERLKERGPEWYLIRARQESHGGNSTMEYNVARQIISEYNRGTRGTDVSALPLERLFA
jgi:hypothetical protein